MPVATMDALGVPVVAAPVAAPLGQGAFSPAADDAAARFQAALSAPLAENADLQKKLERVVAAGLTVASALPEKVESQPKQTAIPPPMDTVVRMGTAPEPVTPEAVVRMGTDSVRVGTDPVKVAPEAVVQMGTDPVKVAPEAVVQMGTGPVKVTPEAVVQMGTDPAKVAPEAVVQMGTDPVRVGTDPVRVGTDPVKVTPETVVPVGTDPVSHEKKVNILVADAPKKKTIEGADASTVVLQAAPVTVAAPVVGIEPSVEAGAVQAVSASAVAKAEAATGAEVLIEAATAVADAIMVTPGLLRGEGEVRIQLKPDVLAGTTLSIAVANGTLNVEFLPTVEHVAQLLVANQGQLVQQLSERVHNFQIAVSVRREANRMKA